MAHCWQPVISFSTGQPVDHLHQPTTQRACRRWPDIGISVGPTLAATVGPMAFLPWVYDIGKPMVKLKPLTLVVGGPRNIFIF